MEERIMGENVTQDNNVANVKKKSKVKWIVIAVVAEFNCVKFPRIFNDFKIL